MWHCGVALMNVTKSYNRFTKLCNYFTLLHALYTYLFVDTKEHCDVSLSSEPFNSRHIPGLTQVNTASFVPDCKVHPLAKKKWSYLHFLSIFFSTLSISLSFIVIFLKSNFHQQFIETIVFIPSVNEVQGVYS